jgi:outer membrane immunogenic protein
LPMKALPPLAAPYSWTGCYVGVNAGYGWNNGHSSYRDDPNTTPDIINGIQNQGGLPPISLTVPGPSPSEKGWLGGGGAGCNWQSQRWVFGIEADIDAGNISASQTTRAPLTAGDAAISVYFVGPQLVTANINYAANAYEQVSVHWLSTVRGRLGFAAQDRLLLFVTGGLAVGRVSTQGSVNIAIPGFTPDSWFGTNSETRFGGVIGGGAEWAFSNHWSAKAEYLWYDLGSIHHSLNCTGATFPCGGITGQYATLGNTSSSVYGSIVRVGLNYKIN